MLCSICGTSGVNVAVRRQAADVDLYHRKCAKLPECLSNADSAFVSIGACVLHAINRRGSVRGDVFVGQLYEMSSGKHVMLIGFSTNTFSLHEYLKFTAYIRGIVAAIQPITMSTQVLAVRGNIEIKIMVV